MLRPADAADMLGVTTQTLRNWARGGKLDRTLTVGGTARYIVARPSGDATRVGYIYARVSSSKLWGQTVMC